MCAAPKIKVNGIPYRDTMCNMSWLFECCVRKPFTMVLEGVVDSEISERDFIDLCCSVGDSLDFGICYAKTIVEVRKFQVPDTVGYQNKFSFYVTFPNNRGTKSANRQFVADKMARLLEGILEDDLPVGLEGKLDYSGQQTFALITVL